MKRRFATTLKDLGPTAANLIPEHLAAGALGGYVFEVAGTEDGFVIKANPERRGKSGNTSYDTDDSLVIRYNDQTNADRDSPPVK